MPDAAGTGALARHVAAACQRRGVWGGRTLRERRSVILDACSNSLVIAHHRPGLGTPAPRPRGAPHRHELDPCHRQEGWEETPGPTAYLTAKAKGDKSMPSKQMLAEGV